MSASTDTIPTAHPGLSCRDAPGTVPLTFALVKRLVVGLGGLEPPPSSLSGFCPGPISRGWHVRPARTTYRWRPLETVTNRSAPMACGPNVDQARPARGGSGAPRRGPCRGKGDPRRLPPTSEPAWAIALLGGALAGSGPGTSPCIGGLSVASGMVVPQRCARSNHTEDGGWLADMADQTSSLSGTFAGHRLHASDCGCPLGTVRCGTRVARPVRMNALSSQRIGRTGYREADAK